MSDSLSLLFKKERREQIAVIALYRRVMRANCNGHSLKKSDVSDSVVISSFALKNEQITRKFRSFHYVVTVFHCFSPSLCPRANSSHCSSLHRSLKKSDGSDLLTPLFPNSDPEFFRTKKRAFRSKISERIPNPSKEPPHLQEGFWFF